MYSRQPDDWLTDFLKLYKYVMPTETNPAKFICNLCSEEVEVTDKGAKKHEACIIMRTLQD